MLKEPRAHDVGGMFRQNPPLVFGLFIFTVQQGRKVQVYLANKNQEGGGRVDYMVWILLPRKQRETTNYLFFCGGKGRNTSSRVTMVTKFTNATKKKEPLTIELHEGSGGWRMDEDLANEAAGQSWLPC